ncbi:MAG: hypothetical protein LUI12_12210 [Clostridiales bacterium]|nr:hypothetical protein [Clostridiales bacterium]
MGYRKKTLQELDLMDDFLSNAMATSEEVSEPFYRLLLSVLLGKEVKKIRILAQHMIPAVTLGRRGICLDVEITEYEGENITSVYDVEPHRKDQLHLPRHNRFYQAKIDGRYVRRGLKDFSKVPDLYVITITDYDPFGMDYMMYTVRNHCIELPEMEYNDGLQFIYFNTKGKKGGSQKIKNVLTYFQNSDSTNVVDEATRTMDSYVRQVKGLPEMEGGFMTVGDWIDDRLEEMREALIDDVRQEVSEQITKEVTDQITKEVTDQVTKEVTDQVTKEVTDQVTKEVTDQVTKKVTAQVTEKVTREITEQDIRFFISAFQRYACSKEETESLLKEQYPEYADRIEELTEKDWSIS